LVPAPHSTRPRYEKRGDLEKEIPLLTPSVTLPRSLLEDSYNVFLNEHERDELSPEE
jgi:hypothetical protein